MTKIIEYRDATGPHKVIVPDDCDDPAGGIPYGEPWELLAQTITAEQVAQALRECGIWTIGDLRRNIKQAKAALLGVMGTVLGDLLSITREVKS